MDILKAATEWAKDEVFSSLFFIFFGVLFVLGGIGFWQMGKTEIARAYIIPTVITGSLLLIVGVGIHFANRSRVVNFPIAYQKNAKEFIASEIVRTEKSLQEYKIIVFKIIPVIVMVLSLFIIFIDKPTWRASSIAVITMLLIIIVVDSNANARLTSYHQELIATKRK